MFVINELAIFIATVPSADQTDYGYTLVFFSEQIRQKWFAKTGFVSLKDFVFLTSAAPDLEGAVLPVSDAVDHVRRQRGTSAQRDEVLGLKNSPELIWNCATVKQAEDFSGNWYPGRTSNGVVEGLNSKIQAVKSNARGFRNFGAACSFAENWSSHHKNLRRTKNKGDADHCGSENFF